MEEDSQSNTLGYNDASPQQSTDSDSSGRTGKSASSETLKRISDEKEDDDHSPRLRKRRRAASDVGSSTVTTPPLSEETPSSMSLLPTHDISHVPYHLSTIEMAAKQVQAAAVEAWDRRFRYKDVFALLLYWEDDDLNVAPEVAALEATLSQVYHYKAETWKIPTKKPDWQIKARLIQFLTLNDAEGNLVIFYYAGHAMPNPQSGGAPLWTS